MFKEFKQFALRGNMLDLAVGVIIGGAFGGVVNSLVKDVVLASIGGLIRLDFNSWVLPLAPSGRGLNMVELQARGIPYLGYGAFLTVLLNFFFLALALFIVVKAYNKAKQRFDREQAALPVDPPPEVKLLGEIRDLLARRESGPTQARDRF